MVVSPWPAAEIERRRFLKAGAAFSVAALVPGAGAMPKPPRLHKALFDGRFAASSAFAARAQLKGLALAEIDGDVTEVWFHDLYHLWNGSRLATIGCLHDASVFCLDLLARDQGMVLWRHAATAIGPDCPARQGQRLTCFVIAARGEPVPAREGFF